MGGDDVRVGVVSRVLHRAEIIDFLVAGDDHHAAGMLSGGALDIGTAQRQPFFFRPGHLLFPLFQVLEHKAVSGFFRHGTHSAGLEHMALAEQLKGVAVGLSLVLTREVQVNIRDLGAAVAQKGFKGDVEAVLVQLRAADRAGPVGQVRSAAVLLLIHLEVGELALGTAVVRRQAVDLGNTGQKSHNGRAHTASGANQITVLQGVVHQLLGGHINNVILALDNAGQLQVDSVLDNLR